MSVLKFKSFDDKEETTILSYENNNKSDINYLQNYLQTVLNRFVKVDFLIGNDNLISKEGILKEVGTDYIVLEMLQSNDLLACDMYSIKFVQII